MKSNESRPSSNPYLFIVGCPRSGTTLLKRLLDAHSMVSITRESHWIPRFYKKRIGLENGRVTPGIIPELLSYHRFAFLGVGKDDLKRILSNAQELSYAEFVSGIFDLFGQRQGKPLVGDKTPGYVRRIRVLHELWPHAKFVHLVRDGRDVCLSVLNWKKAKAAAGRVSTWEEDPVSTTALWWKRNVRMGREAGALLGPRLYSEVRYEALCRNPEAECRKLCRFLGLPFRGEMLRYHEGKTKDLPGLSAKSAFLPPTPGLRDWRVQMEKKDLERFEAAAADALAEFNYEPGLSRISAGARAHALRIREAFSGSSLPRRW